MSGRSMNDDHALETTIRERSRGAGDRAFAVVDFDNTCIANDVTEVTLAHMCRHHLLRHELHDVGLLPGTPQERADYHARVFRRYYELLDAGDITSASLLCARAFAGFTREEATTLVSAAIDAEQQDTSETELYGVRIVRGIAVRPVLRTLLALLEQNRVATWIVSASPEIAVRTAMQRFGLSGQLIGLRPRLRGNVLSDEIETPYSIAEGKVECIKAFIDPERRPLLGVGDSMHDVPMLDYCEIGAVVDLNKVVVDTARGRGWFILRC